jgi:hypothetical protein
MQKIYKYELNPEDCQTISIPKGSQWLTLQMQLGVPCLWAKVDTENEMENRTIIMYGTGHLIKEEALVYLGTFQLMGGTLVFHVFEKLL